MTNEDKYDYWLDIAQYDFESADAMCSTGRWLYVIFMCQQSIEKLVKGLYTLYIGDNVPPIHDINSIFSKFKNKLTVPVDETVIDFFSWLTSFYLNTRYPKFKAKLSAAVSKQDAETTLKKAKEVFAWLLTLKPSTESSDNISTT
ncbi:HEPN domain-containing protein [Treponema primitia]|uniref:HEPN domain-containing protein n=1 Tax=Treponema primitia TaxID=88058 RepID=UPI0002554C69